MITWKDCWNEFNRQLAKECCYGNITEEEMESLLDHGQLRASAEELRYFAVQNGYQLVDGDKEKMGD